MKMQVIGLDGSGGSQVEFPETVYSTKYNFDLVDQFITTYIHNSHSNTKAQKNRSAVRGGGRKPWRQKGTGRARAGTIRSPLWRSGGVAFAHVFKPSKKKKVNKKMYRAALRSIFSSLINEDRLIVVDSLKINEPPKTSEVKNLLLKLDLSNAVFVFKENNKNFDIASKNLFNVSSQTINSLNPVDLIKAEKVVFTLDAITSLTEVLSK